jgi:hypothetical protein
MFGRVIVDEHVQPASCCHKLGDLAICNSSLPEVGFDYPNLIPIQFNPVFEQLGLGFRKVDRLQNDCGPLTLELGCIGRSLEITAIRDETDLVSQPHRHSPLERNMKGPAAVPSTAT